MGGEDNKADQTAGCPTQRLLLFTSSLVQASTTCTAERAFSVKRRQRAYLKTPVVKPVTTTEQSVTSTLTF